MFIPGRLGPVRSKTRKEERKKRFGGFDIKSPRKNKNSKLIRITRKEEEAHQKKERMKGPCRKGEGEKRKKKGVTSCLARNRQQKAEVRDTHQKQVSWNRKTSKQEDFNTSMLFPSHQYRKTLLTSLRYDGVRVVVNSGLIWLIPSSDGDEVFLKKKGLFIITDDLYVRPFMLDKSIQLLKTLGVEYINLLDERTIYFGVEEGAIVGVWGTMGKEQGGAGKNEKNEGVHVLNEGQMTDELRDFLEISLPKFIVDCSLVVKFNVNRVDNMVIHAIFLLDTLDKDVNSFSMRVREWYSWHFSELVKIVNYNYLYAKTAQYIGDKVELSEDKLEGLIEILGDEDKAKLGFFTARLDQCQDVCTEVVGARLISHAGSLTNLAKCPSSTLQILGAKKALFWSLLLSLYSS
ncbi:nucleolar protein 56-like protein [Tanacetum coccineum]